MPAPSVDISGLRRELEAQLEGEVRFDAVSRALYSTDASVYRIAPVGVALVKSREDVMRTIALCRRYRCPVTMRGGGTSQAGQAIGSGLILDTSKFFNRLLEVDVDARWARVEPGIVLDELNAALKPHGLRFAPDISTASRATLGGMMANNSAGARSVIYGKTIDHVIEQDVVLSDGSLVRFGGLDPEAFEARSQGATLEAACYREVRATAVRLAGEIERRYPKVIRRVGGYNLDDFTDDKRPLNMARIMVGSEGTLGVVVEARVALVPLPRAKAVLAVQFHDLLEALGATPAILAHRPSAIEVMDRFILDHTKQSPPLEQLRQKFINGDPAALLCIEMYDEHAENLPPRLDALERDLTARQLGYRYVRALEPAAQAAIWSLRESALGLSMAMKGDAKSLSFVEDTAVAPERLRDYIERFLAMIHAHGTSAGVYAHASVGCLHVRPVVNLKTEAGVRQFEAIASASADLVLEFGGALSGEHGDGLVRSPFMERMFGREIYEGFRHIKQTFDPENLFNPGKIVDAPPLTSQLRYGPAYRAVEPATFFDYGEFGGLTGAVEMCSGLGVCRKTLDGTMCPSYMATREETHSTRGRANVLRQAMAGELGDAGLDDHGVRAVLDLCLECRACKSECPVGVDVARFKSEFLAGYYARHGTPLGARALGHVDTISRWGSRFAPLSNAVARSRPVRWINERLLGLDRRRVPPAFAPRTFEREFRTRPSPVRGPTGRPAVAIFADTFTNYYNPSIGLAGADVLDTLGFDVSLAGNTCCGRPLISQGLLDDARRAAAANLDRLSAAVERGAMLAFFEPSCLSAVVEDAPALLRNGAQRRARQIAEHALLFEEIVERRCQSPDHALRLSAGPSQIVLHGHCHQKAMGRVGATRALLTRVPGAGITELDSGCCGMAGSFGYHRAHFEVSRSIGERRVLPAARQLGAGAVMIASGVSCRHQIADFAGVRAWHPAELLRSLIVTAPS